jgi:hypothetical protein
VQVDPIKRTLKLPGTERLKLKCDILLSTFASRFNVRRHKLVKVFGERVSLDEVAAGDFTLPLLSFTLTLFVGYVG